jgi:hypothetical protein
MNFIPFLNYLNYSLYILSLLYMCIENHFLLFILLTSFIFILDNKNTWEREDTREPKACNFMHNMSTFFSSLLKIRSREGFRNLMKIPIYS